MCVAPVLLYERVSCVFTLLACLQKLQDKYAVSMVKSKTASLPQSKFVYVFTCLFIYLFGVCVCESIHVCGVCFCVQCMCLFMFVFCKWAPGNV